MFAKPWREAADTYWDLECRPPARSLSLSDEDIGFTCLADELHRNLVARAWDWAEALKEPHSGLYMAGYSALRLILSL